MSSPPYLLTLLAHIDHGKTTFSDALLSTLSSALNPKSVGLARLLDSTNEERRRGITIRLSHTSLVFDPEKFQLSNLLIPPPKNANLTIIDSPGHHDFQSNVGRALNITPSSVLLVDSLEGVRARTIGVIAQSVKVQNTPLLVLNKCDKNLDTLRGTISQINATTATLTKYSSEQMQENYQFKPETDGVIFAAATQCWGISFKDYIRLLIRRNNKFQDYSNPPSSNHNTVAPSKINFNKLLSMCYDPKKIIKWDPQANKISVYKCETGEGTFDFAFPSFVKGIIEAPTASSALAHLSETNLIPRQVLEILQSAKNLKLGHEIMRHLFPLAKSTVRAIITTFEPPTPHSSYKNKTYLTCEGTRLVDALDVIGDVKGEIDNVTICRVWDERVNDGDILWTLKEGEWKESRVRVMEWKENSFKCVESVEAGRCCGVWFESVVNCDIACMDRENKVKREKPVENEDKPISITVRPEKEADRSDFETALNKFTLLEDAQVVVTERGEVVISSGGEVEMENLIHDFRELYSNVSIIVGERRISYRESVAMFPNEVHGYKAPVDAARKALGQFTCTPWNTTLGDCEESGWIVKNGTCKCIIGGNNVKMSVYPRAWLWEGDTADTDVDEVENDKIKFNSECKDWAVEGENWCGGRKNVEFTKEVKESLIAGFREATKAGIVAEEPMHGVVVVFEGLGVEEVEEVEGEPIPPPPPIDVGGHFISQISKSIRLACLSRPCRIAESYVRCDFQSGVTSLGAVYDTVSKRRGKVIEEIMVEGTEMITIVVALPLSETTGLTNELLDRSSGEASAPMMAFSHWQLMSLDPFWRPTTEEEREEYGEGLKRGDKSTGIANVAQGAVRKVRRAKGMVVEEDKLVDGADKQRNMKKKK